MHRGKDMWVYILASKHRCLYVGVTNNLEVRVYQHKMKVNEGYTSRYAVNRLVYFEKWDNPEDAIRREKQIKGWRRVRMIALIESMNREWKDLAERWFESVICFKESNSMDIGQVGDKCRDPSLHSG